MILTGEEAIDYARKNNELLSKYCDPLEGGRSGLSVDEATDIAREDPALIYIHTEEHDSEVIAMEWAQEILSQMTTDDVEAFEKDREEWRDGISMMVWPECLSETRENLDLVMAELDNLCAFHRNS